MYTCSRRLNVAVGPRDGPVVYTNTASLVAQMILPSRMPPEDRLSRLIIDVRSLENRRLPLFSTHARGR